MRLSNNEKYFPILICSTTDGIKTFTLLITAFDKLGTPVDSSNAFQLIF